MRSMTPSSRIAVVGDAGTRPESLSVVEAVRWIENVISSTIQLTVTVHARGCPKSSKQVRLDSWPLLVQHAEVHAVSHCFAGDDHVFAEHALFNRSETGNRGA